MICTLKLNRKCIDDCTRLGVPADNVVKHWLTDPKVKAQLSKIPADAIRAHLKEYGAWYSEELGNHEENLMRTLWIACGDCKEAMYLKQPKPCTVYIEGWVN